MLLVTSSNLQEISNKLLQNGCVAACISPAPLSYPDSPPFLFGEAFQSSLKYSTRAVAKDKTKNVTVSYECSHLQGGESGRLLKTQDTGPDTTWRCISKQWFQWAQASFVPATCPLLQQLLYILAPPSPPLSGFSELLKMLSAGLKS